MPIREAVEEQLATLKGVRDQAKLVWDGTVRAISITRSKLVTIRDQKNEYIDGGGADSTRLAEFEAEIADLQKELETSLAFEPTAERKYAAAAAAFNNSPRT